MESSITDEEVPPHSPDSLFSVDLSELGSSQELQSTAADPPPKQESPRASHGSSSLEEPSGFKPARLLSTTLSIVPFSPVQGLYYLPNLIDHATENEFMRKIGEMNFFNNQSNNQMMFFSRLNHLISLSKSSPKESDCHGGKLEHAHLFTKWPTFLVDLIHRLPSLLCSANPENLDEINDLFFGPDKLNLPWQVIINLYKPGQGIEQHVDLVGRFDEIILGISLGSSVAIQFEPIDPHESNAIEKLYLEQRSGYIISREARYRWTHGILPNQLDDWVLDYATNETRKIIRTRTRVSITIRRLKLDADLLQD